MDDIRFKTGFDIIPYVITELRLLHCLERYYGIKRDLRYISLTDRFKHDTKIEEISIEKVKRDFADVKEKTIAILYADNGNNSVLNANVGYLSKLATMAGIAFEIMLLGKKLLGL